MPLITKWRSILNKIRPRPVELPTEIWLYIAEFIPKNDIRKLAGVNRVFYELVMNDLYHELNLINSNPRQFMILMHNLRNPSLAGRVRVLKIWPGQQQSRYRSSLWDAPPATVWHSSQSRSPANLASLPSPEEHRSLFLDALKGLSRVEDCRVKWHYNECQPMSIKIRAAIWSVIGANLFALTINISADKLGDVISPLLSQNPTILSQLETLSILFTERHDMNMIVIEAIHDFVVPFINNHARTLRSLHISSSTMDYSTKTDLSRIFHSFVSFPCLKILKLGMQFYSRNFQDPSGLQRFLREHPTIRSLELRYTDPHACHLLKDDVSGDGHLLYDNIVLPHLLELMFGLKIPGGINNPLLSYEYIARMCPSITSLILFDRSLSLDEVSTALQAFNVCCRLQSFSLVVKTLDPELLDLLAQGLPFLKRLVVVADKITGHTDFYPPKRSNVRSFRKALIYRRDVDYYVNWKLQDIMIKSCVDNIGLCYMWTCMQSVANLVTSIDAKDYVRQYGVSYSVVADVDL